MTERSGLRASWAMDVARFVVRSTRRLVVAIVGFALLVAGVVMMVTPGPGIPSLLLGLFVLGTEFAWARRSLEKARSHAATLGAAARRRGRSSGAGGGTRTPNGSKPTRS